MKKLFQNLFFLFKKAFQSFLLLLGIFFLIMSISMAWNIFFVDGMGIPTDGELVVECNELIDEGSYNNFDEGEQLGACLDDSYKAAGAAPFIIILFPVILIKPSLNLSHWEKSRTIVECFYLDK